MDISDHHSKQKICPKHNQTILFYNSDPLVGACCLICLQHLPGMTSAEQINIQQRKAQNQANQEIERNLQQLQQLLATLLSYKEMLIQSLDKIIKLIFDQLELVKESKNKLTNLVQSESNKLSLVDELKLILDNQQQFNQDWKNQVEKQFNSFYSKYQEIEKLLAVLNNNPGSEKGKNLFELKKKQIIIQEVKVGTPKNFQYELIKESNLKQAKDCFALAFNKENSILVVGCLKEIIVYEIIKAKISKEMQILQNHTSTVYSLYFMRNSNSFVSGSYDKSIIIWVLDQNKKYIAQQVLKEHNDSVCCIIMNKNEEYIISGSIDETLKVWRKVSGNWACSQNISTKDMVRNMSLNEVEDKLITCQNYDKSSIQILVLQNGQKWNIVQTLVFSGNIYRVCFTIGDQFIMQNRTLNSLEIYDYDANKKEFKAVSQVQMQQIETCDDCFPCQFIKSLQILTFKHGKYLNILNVNEGYNYELIQTIQYEHHCLYGRLTDDGQYLVTWDKSSKKISFSQIQYKE